MPAGVQTQLSVSMIAFSLGEPVTACAKSICVLKRTAVSRGYRRCTVPANLEHESIRLGSTIQKVEARHRVRGVWFNLAAHHRQPLEAQVHSACTNLERESISLRSTFQDVAIRHRVRNRWRHTAATRGYSRCIVCRSGV